MDSTADSQVTETTEISYPEPLAESGCPKRIHLELTLGKGRFEGVKCPKCGQEVYKP